MTENKWIIDGHHYTCPNCKKTIAIVVNESDEGFDFCPFCGKRIEGLNMEDDKLEVTHLLGKKLDKPIMLKFESEAKKNKMENEMLSVGLCKDTLEVAIGEVDTYIPKQVLESTLYYLKEYERLRALQSWSDFPEAMGR